MAMTILTLIKPRIVFQRFLIRYQSSYKLTEKDVEEIQIPVPWGHIAGKWWGDKTKPPVLAIHGWQDNANSFDALIPLLDLSSVLAIDLPGHGISSHFPEGMTYDFSDMIMSIYRIKRHFGWSKVPLLTHSLGGALGYVYATVFPTEVKWLISTECIRTALSFFTYAPCPSIRTAVDKFIRAEDHKIEKLNPAHKLSEWISMILEGSIGSICDPEKAVVLLKRVLVPSEPHTKATVKAKGSSDLDVLFKIERDLVKIMSPEEQKLAQKYFDSLKMTLDKARAVIKKMILDESDDKYYTSTTDPCIKTLFVHIFDEDFLLRSNHKITCPVLSVRTNDGFLHGASKKLYDGNLEILKKSCAYFEHHDIDGTHHVHLCSPENLAPIINNFIKKF